MSEEQPIQAAWRIEANTISEMDYEVYRNIFIHETSSIKAFLSSQPNDRTILVAPKGYGKTLLLIAKKQSFIEAASGHIIMAKDRFIDRPIGHLPIGKRENLAHWATDYEFWKALWKISLSLSAIKAFARVTKDHSFDRISLVNEWYKRIFGDEHNYMEACEIFADLITQNHRSIIEIISTSTLIFPFFNRINTPVVFFIDNIDEFFVPVLEDRSARTQNTASLNRSKGNDWSRNNDSALYRNRNNDVWLVAQIALAAVAYELEKVNRHVKIFCTMRHEAFLKMADFGSDSFQISGRCIRIEYSSRDLEKIFYKNIDITQRNDLAAPDDDDLMCRFVGPENKIIKHRFVGKSEHIFHYFLRHTLYRPRDLMHIGGAIARINPCHRSVETIYDAVDAATKDIVNSIFAEMSPFFATPQRDYLLRHIETNVLTVDQLREIRNAYVRDLGVRDPGETDSGINQPFLVLHRLGLLGTVRPELRDRNHWRQYFLQPTEIQIENGTRLPHSEYYLIHPALDKSVYEKTSGKLVRGFHRKNIVGNGLEWVDPIAYSFALKGDFVGFSKMMDSDMYGVIVSKLYEWAREVCRDLAHVEFEGGDSIVMIDPSPQKVVGAAKGLIDRALSFREGPMKMRFGGAAGPIAYERGHRLHNGNWDRIVVPRGLALRTSARLEPYAAPGSILVDELFYEFGASRGAPDHDVAAGGEAHVEGLPGDLILPLLREDVPVLKYRENDQKFIIQKNELDPPHFTKLYQIKLRS